MERLRDAGRPVSLPPIDVGGYLFAAFMDLGLVTTGMAIQPLSWSEIDAFARLTGDIVEPWEARLMRGMSNEYLAGRDIGKDPLGIPPWEELNG